MRLGGRQRMLEPPVYLLSTPGASPLTLLRLAQRRLHLRHQVALGRQLAAARRQRGLAPRQLLVPAAQQAQVVLKVGLQRRQAALQLAQCGVAGGHLAQKGRRRERVGQGAGRARVST